MSVHLTPVFALILAAIPGVGVGREALTVTCKTVTRCDAGGTCGAHRQGRTIVIQPTQVDADGAGQVQLTLDGKRHDALALSEVGPFFWEPRRNGLGSLTVTGNDQVLLVETRYGTNTRSTIDHLNCQGL